MKLAQPYSIIDTIKVGSNDFDIAVKSETYYLCSKSDSKDILSGFFDIWRRPKDLREDLLKEIDSVLSGEAEFTDVGADIMGLAYIEPQTTKLMGSDVGYADMELPTVEFREIVLKWLEFLETHGK
jgi:hypothetical protein